MTQLAKRYRTAYQKRIDVERDTYPSHWSPKSVLYCNGCGAIYYRRRWTLTPPPDVRDWAEFRDGVSAALCPNCRKLREH